MLGGTSADDSTIADAERVQSDVADKVPLDKGGQPGWTISSWLTSLSLLNIVANHVLRPRPEEEEGTASETQWIKAISEEQMEKAIDDSLPDIKAQILRNWRELQRQKHVDATEMNQKFLTVLGLSVCSASTFSHTLSAGKKWNHVQLWFHGGLSWWARAADRTASSRYHGQDGMGT